MYTFQQCLLHDHQHARADYGLEQSVLLVFFTFFSPSPFVVFASIACREGVPLSLILTRSGSREVSGELGLLLSVNCCCLLLAACPACRMVRSAAAAGIRRKEPRGDPEIYRSRV